MGNTLVWKKGRQLKQYGVNTYRYNNEGIRIKKTTSGEIHEYILDGTNIIKETWNGNTLIPLYDLDGTVCGLKYNGVAYYFYKNLQGDVIAITDDTGETVARYTYDAWGKVLTVKDANGTAITDINHIANINPFRYRSYYYDTETELYYLQSRYYDPEVGRFINADDVEALGTSVDVISHNIYTYSLNSPIENRDNFGTFSIKSILDVLNNVIEVIAKGIEWILKKYNISRRNYIKRNRYKTKKDIRNLVHKNKNSIKKLGKNLKSIGFFVDILMVVVDCKDMFKNQSNEFRAMAEILFYGLIRLINWAVSSLISFLLTKICAALFWLKFVLKNILMYIFDKIFNNYFAERVKTHYLNCVDPSGMSLGDYFVALFRGTIAAFA